jgi:hypothetical protein
MRVSKTDHTNHGRQESTGYITGLAKVAAQCSAVRQMADEKNTYLRQAPNLYVL